VTIDPKYANATYTVTRKPDGDIVLSVEVEWCGLTFSTLMVYYKVYTEQPGGSRSYDKFRDKSFDLCKIAQGFTTDLVLRTITEEVKKCADFEMKCPFKKVSLYDLAWQLSHILKLQGTYKIARITVSDRFIPRILLNQNLNGLIVIQVIGKIRKEKRNIEIAKVKLIGGISKA
jgi:hypothetical protein